MIDQRTMTPDQLQKACDKVGGVYAMARLIGKGSTPQYLYRRLRGKVYISEFDSLAIRKALELHTGRKATRRSKPNRKAR